MGLFKNKIKAVILLAISSNILAQTETSDIEINVTTDAYVSFIGDLANNVSKNLTVEQVNGTVTNLGSLGTESNTTGGCDLDISTINNFRLQHDVDSNLFLHATNRYSINYAGKSFTSGSQTLSFSSCNNPATPFQIATPGFDANQLQAGIYSDIVTVTITTQ